MWVSLLVWLLGSSALSLHLRVHPLLHYWSNGVEYGTPAGLSVRGTLDILENLNRSKSISRRIIVITIEDVNSYLKDLVNSKEFKDKGTPEPPLDLYSRFFHRVLMNRGVLGLLIVLPTDQFSFPPGVTGEDYQNLESSLLQTSFSKPIYFIRACPEIENLVNELKIKDTRSFLSSYKFGQLGEGTPKANVITDFDLFNFYGILHGSNSRLDDSKKKTTDDTDTDEDEDESDLIAIVANYDSFSIAPTMPSTSGSSGVLALLEIARIFHGLYSHKDTISDHDFIFLLTSGSRFLHSYDGSRYFVRKTLGQGRGGDRPEETSDIASRVKFVICLGEGLDTQGPLYLHMSEKMKDDADFVSLLVSFKKLSREMGIEMRIVIGKEGEHDVYHESGVPALTVSGRKSLRAKDKKGGKKGESKTKKEKDHKEKRMGLDSLFLEHEFELEGLVRSIRFLVEVIGNTLYLEYPRNNMKENEKEKEKEKEEVDNNNIITEDFENEAEWISIPTMLLFDQERDFSGVKERITSWKSGLFQLHHRGVLFFSLRDVVTQVLFKSFQFCLSKYCTAEVKIQKFSNKLTKRSSFGRKGKNVILYDGNVKGQWVDNQKKKDKKYFGWHYFSVYSKVSFGFECLFLFLLLCYLCFVVFLFLGKEKFGKLLETTILSKSEKKMDSFTSHSRHGGQKRIRKRDDDEKALLKKDAERISSPYSDRGNNTRRRKGLFKNNEDDEEEKKVEKNDDEESDGDQNIIDLEELEEVE